MVAHRVRAVSRAWATDSARALATAAGRALASARASASALESVLARVKVPVEQTAAAAAVRGPAAGAAFRVGAAELAAATENAETPTDSVEVEPAAVRPVGALAEPAIFSVLAAELSALAATATGCAPAKVAAKASASAVLSARRRATTA